MKKTLALMLLLAGLTLEAQGRTLYWTGAESSDWNWSDKNWVDEYGSRVVYEDGDAVVFNNAGSGEVNVQSYFSPASVLVDSENNYTFTGNCSLEGSMTLTKRGTGTLTINSDRNEIGILVNEGTLVLGSDRALGTEPNVTLEGGTLDLGGNTFHSDDSSFILKGNTNSIGNGTINGVLTVPDHSTLTLCGDLGGSDRLVLRGDSTLNLDGHTLTKQPNAMGYTTISHGEIVLNWTLLGAVLEDVTLDLNGNTTYYCAPESLKGSCSIGNGTIIGFNHSLRVEGDSTLTLFGITRIKDVTITAGQTQVKSLVNDTPGLMKELTISKGLIAGTDRQSSLADGMDISRMGYDLTLENLVLTANNKISVGDGHTITLNNVTIKISDDVCTLVNGIYTIDLKNLINCDLKMENVLLDASDLTLPQGFDLAKDAVAFDFGDDVSIQKATGLDMRLGNYRSTSLNLDQQGKVIFSKLVETPEPTTGTLSLLALAALAARRRRK